MKSELRWRVWLVRHWWLTTKNAFWLAVARRMPHDMRYWAVIDAWAKASMTMSADDSPIGMSVDEVLKRLGDPGIKL